MLQPINSSQMNIAETPTEDDILFATSNNLQYQCNTTTLYKDIHLLGKFLRLGPDKHTKSFIAECHDEYRSKFLTSVKYLFLKPTLSLLYSHTDLNGLLGVGQMSILSTNQLGLLFKNELLQSNGKLGHLLDVGAGCGRITSLLAPLFTSVTATEVSPVMVKHLARRGFTALQCGDLRDSALGTDGFDVISILNVIDRCDTPVTLLREATKRLRDRTSCILLATPLPLNPSVETSAGDQ